MTDQSTPELRLPDPSEQFVEEDLVVALPHRRLVEAALAERQIRCTGDPDTNPRLGLALLPKLTGVEAQAARVLAAHGARIAAMESASGRPANEPLP